MNPIRETDVKTKREPSKEVRINYTNYKKRLSFRHIRPIEIFYGSNEWHPEPQWLLRAWDLDKEAERTFAMKDIHFWGVAPEQNGDDQ